MNNLEKILIVSFLAILVLVGCNSSSSNNNTEMENNVTLQENITTALEENTTLPEETNTTINEEVNTTEALNKTNAKSWSYSGDMGPDNWQSQGFIQGGESQSPINIEESAATPEDPKVEEVINYGLDIFKEFNNGHTVEAIPSSKNNNIVIGDDTYTLAQFHFHTPSEHQLDGENFDMELHLVNKDPNGGISVFGVFIKEGNENGELSNMWAKLPQNLVSEEDAIAIDDEINLMNLLPEDKTKYEYTGSLTTPPCTEGVKWYVFKNPIEMSKEQIDKFKSVFNDDHRPVQPLNGRQIYID